MSPAPLDLADELIEVALLGDDERVQLILLEGAVRQRRQKLPRIFPPREPFRELPQLGRAHAHDGGRVDVRDELRLERPVPLIRMGDKKRANILLNRHRSPFLRLFARPRRKPAGYPQRQKRKTVSHHCLLGHLFPVLERGRSNEDLTTHRSSPSHPSILEIVLFWSDSAYLRFPAFKKACFPNRRVQNSTFSKIPD